MNYYSETEKILLNQGKFNISLELDRINAVLRLLGNPQNSLKVIHVAGTNGKGSTCAIINQILIDNGYKVGFYTSPHLVKYNERIKINNIPISDKKMFDFVCKINNIAKAHKINLTEFELLTAVTYKYFEEEKVDFAVIEVGLGGRFDATNCIEKPLVSVISSISYDHTDKLGDTIDKIAFEKSGIIKQNCPVVFSKNNKGSKILTKIANKLNSPIYFSKPSKIEFIKGQNILNYNGKIFEFSLLGKYQADNASLALRTIEILKMNGVKINYKSVISGLKNVKWPCRMEFLKEINVILDGCHNPDGAKVLRESLDFYFPSDKRIFVYTSLKNKDYNEVQKKLFRTGDLIYHYDMNDERFITKFDIDNCIESVTVEGIKKLIKNKNKEDLLIICGSLYALGDILGKIKLCS